MRERTCVARTDTSGRGDGPTASQQQPKGSTPPVREPAIKLGAHAGVARGSGRWSVGGPDKASRGRAVAASVSVATAALASSSSVTYRSVSPFSSKCCHGARSSSMVNGG